MGRLLKFGGYIHHHKILRFSTFSKEFCWPSITKGIIGRDLKLAGYVHHYEILTENIFGLILKNKMIATVFSFQS